MKVNNKFLEWLSSNGVWVKQESAWGRAPHPLVISSSTEDDGESCGRGLLARDGMSEGELMMTIPLDLCLTRGLVIFIITVACNVSIIVFVLLCNGIMPHYLILKTLLYSSLWNYIITTVCRSCLPASVWEIHRARYDGRVHRHRAVAHAREAERGGFSLETLLRHTTDEGRCLSELRVDGG